MKFKKEPVSLDRSVNAVDWIKGHAVLLYLLSKKELGFFSRCFVEDIARYRCDSYSKQGEEKFLKFGEVLENNRPNTEGWKIFYRVYNEKLEYICRVIV